MGVCRGMPEEPEMKMRVRLRMIGTGWTQDVHVGLVETSQGFGIGAGAIRRRTGCTRKKKSCRKCGVAIENER